MGLLDYFTKEGDAKRASKSVPPIVEEKQQVVVPPVVAPNYHTLPTASKVDYKKMIEDKFDERNLPGPDFLEFRRSVNALASHPLSEQQKYLVTYPTFQTMKVGVDKLVESANYYLKLLDDKEKAFADSIAESTDRRITKREDEVKRLAAENEELSKKIQANAKLMEELNSKANTARHELTVETNSFNVEVSAVRNEINNHILNIQKYLNANVTS